MANKKPFSPEEFKAIYSKATRLCVDLIIKTPMGIVLSLRTIEPYKGKWHLPGGTVLFKEKITDTINRVAMDEVGVNVSVEKLLGYIEYPEEEKNGGFGYSVTIAFLCSTDKTNFKPNEESSEIKIFNKLPKNLIEEQYKFIKEKLAL